MDYMQTNTIELSEKSLVDLRANNTYYISLMDLHACHIKTQESSTKLLVKNKMRPQSYKTTLHRRHIYCNKDT